MMTYYDLKYINTFKKGKNRKKKHICPLLYVIHNRAVGRSDYLTLFKTEELFLINYPGLLTPDLGCIYHEYS